jgi:putative transposase
LIAVPKSPEGLRRALGGAHRRYTRRVNFRQRCRGHLWQGRFASFVIDKQYLLSAARYVELNPVRARRVRRPEKYRWSSAAAHLRGQDDVLVKVAPLLGLVPDWQGFLNSGLNEDELARLRRHDRTGRPLGDESFLRRLEKRVGRVLRRLKPGPKPKREKK